MEGNARNAPARTIRVAAVQTASQNGLVAANLAHAVPLVEQSAGAGAQLVLLPELMPSGYELTEAIWDAAESAVGPQVTVGPNRQGSGPRTPGATLPLRPVMTRHGRDEKVGGQRLHQPRSRCWLHPVIWKALNDGDRGCMVSPSK